MEVFDLRRARAWNEDLVSEGGGEEGVGREGVDQGVVGEIWWRYLEGLPYARECMMAFFSQPVNLVVNSIPPFRDILVCQKCQL